MTVLTVIRIDSGVSEWDSGVSEWDCLFVMCMCLPICVCVFECLCVSMCILCMLMSLYVSIGQYEFQAKSWLLDLEYDYHESRTQSPIFYTKLINKLFNQILTTF